MGALEAGVGEAVRLGHLTLRPPQSGVSPSSEAAAGLTLRPRGAHCGR